MFPWIIWSRMKNVKKRYPQTEKKVGRKWLTLEQKRLKAHMQGMPAGGAIPSDFL